MPLSEDQEKRKVPSKQREEQKHEEENKRFEVLLDKLEDITTNGRLQDMAYHFTDTKQVIKTNLIAGVARGVGLTVGTAIFIGLLLFILSQFETMPIIGDFIEQLMNTVNQGQSPE